MARRKRFSIEDIQEAAFQVVRKNGIHHLTARAIAREMKSSTMPIYTCVSSMREIEESVVKQAWRVLQAYQSRSWDRGCVCGYGAGVCAVFQGRKYLFQCIHAEAYETINTRYSEKPETAWKNFADHPMFKTIFRPVAEKFCFTDFCSATDLPVS
ncbi:MAG: hypothetical protein R2861_15685 [Desulfobacterales bacterium]